MSKTITVFGATGNQGGSVVAEILAHPELSKTWKIRAVTRDVSKPKALKLKEQGAELVTANLDDKASLVEAIKGSNAVFAVTNFWEHMSGDKEYEQGKNIADAAKEVGVERFIFSSLPNVNKATNGEIAGVAHFDAKALVEDYALKIGVPSTFFQPGTYMSFALQGFQKQDDGSYVWNTPLDVDRVKLPLFAADTDTGLFVAAILLNLDSTLNGKVYGTTGYFTPQAITETFREVTGNKAEVKQIPFDVFRSFLPDAIKDEMTDMLKGFQQVGYYAGEPADGVDKTLALVESSGLRKPVQLKDYVKQNFKA